MNSRGTGERSVEAWVVGWGGKVWRVFLGKEIKGSKFDVD